MGIKTVQGNAHDGYARLIVNGTDHGTANTHFVMGGQVKGGLYGKPPALHQLENGNLVYGVDYRSLYTTVTEKWWRLPASMPNGRFNSLDIIRT